MILLSFSSCQDFIFKCCKDGGVTTIDRWDKEESTKYQNKVKMIETSEDRLNFLKSELRQNNNSNICAFFTLNGGCNCRSMAFIAGESVTAVSKAEKTIDGENIIELDKLCRENVEKHCLPFKSWPYNYRNGDERSEMCNYIDEEAHKTDSQREYQNKKNNLMVV